MVVVLGLIAVIALVVGVLVTLSSNLFHLKTEFSEAGRKAVNAFDEYMLEMKTDLTTAGNSLRVTDRQDELFSLLLDQRPSIFEFLLIDPEGSVLARHHRISSTFAPALVSQQPWVSTVRAGEFYIGRVELSQFSVPSVDLAVPVTDRLGNFAATLVARVDLTRLWNIAIELRVGNDGYVYITDDIGKLVAYRNLRLLHCRVNIGKRLGRTPQSLTDSELHFYRGLSGEPVVATALPMRFAPWFAVIEQPARDALGPVALQSFGLLGAFAIVAFLVSGIVRFTVREILLPLRILRDGIEMLRQGDLRHRIRIKGRDEIGEIAIAFNELAKQLQNSLEDLENRVVELEETKTDLESAQNYLGNIIDSMPSIIVGVRSDCRVILWNRGAQAATDRSADQARLRPVEEVLPHMKGHLQMLRSAITTGAALKEPKQVISRVSENRYWDFMVYPLKGATVKGAVIRIDEVTSRLRFEEMMTQTEKMISIAGLTSGIAHEINNPLGGILQGVQNIQRRLSPDLRRNIAVAEECGTELETLRLYLERRRILHFLDGMREAGLRASKIVANMLSFSRRDEGHKSLVDLRELLDTSVDLASKSYDLKKRYDFRRIQIEREYAEDLPMVRCEKSKIEQVILNLLTNAAQAMSGSAEEPRINLRLTRNKKCVRIEVEDNGPGMPEETRKRAFEPFFTTKEVGVGTGLGLYVSYCIITQVHNGRMTIESSPHEGARFVIDLPV